MPSNMPPLSHFSDDASCRVHASAPGTCSGRPSMIIVRRVGSNAAGESPKVLRAVASPQAAACASADVKGAPHLARTHLQQLPTWPPRLQLGAASLAQRHAAPLWRQSMPGGSQSWRPRRSAPGPRAPARHDAAEAALQHECCAAGLRADEEHRCTRTTYVARPGRQRGRDGSREGVTGRGVAVSPGHARHARQW